MNAVGVSSKEERKFTVKVAVVVTVKRRHFFGSSTGTVMPSAAPTHTLLIKGLAGCCAQMTGTGIANFALPPVRRLVAPQVALNELHGVPGGSSSMPLATMRTMLGCHCWRGLRPHGENARAPQARHKGSG